MGLTTVQKDHILVFNQLTTEDVPQS
jgi:hypothetical protein